MKKKTNKQIVEWLNTLDITDAINALNMAEQWQTTAFYRALSNFKYPSIMYQILLNKGSKYISKAVKTDWFYDFVQYCKDTNNLLSLKFKSKAMVKYTDVPRILKILVPDYELTTIFTDYYYNLLLSTLCDKDIIDTRAVVINTIKKCLHGELWRLSHEIRKGYSLGSHHISINNSEFMRLYNIKDFNRNAKALFMLLVKANCFSAEQKQEILYALRNALTYKTIYLTDYPFELLKEDEYDFLKPVIMALKLKQF